MGIHVIYQEFMLVPQLTVRENIFLEAKSRCMGIVRDVREQRQRVKEILARLGVAIDPEATVSRLSTACQQIVEIAKAVSSNCRLLIMDEPTAPLTEEEVDGESVQVGLLIDHSNELAYCGLCTT